MQIPDGCYIPIDDIEELAHGELLYNSDYKVYRMSDTDYSVSSHRTGYTMVCDSQTVHSIINSGSGWGAASSSISTVFGPGGLQAISFPTLTPEEKKELETLEQEHKIFIKQNRIKKFQNLPKHLRQEIVDECYIRDLVEALASNDDKDFQDMAKLQSLRNKNNHSSGFGGLISVTSGYSMSYGGSSVGKFGMITQHFTTEELAQAHAQACLEEAIQ
jgi:hypothetical protein